MANSVPVKLKQDTENPEGPLKLFLTMLIASALLFSGVRYAFLIEAQLREFHKQLGAEQAIPRDGSLHGVDASGKLIQPGIGAGDPRQVPGYTLLFVIHRRNAVNEIHFWNEVAEAKPQWEATTLRPIQFWGICDDGASCNAFAPSAHFQLVGYLDPYQMHAVAKADLRREALLYDRHETLMAELAQAISPRAEAELILKQVQ